jgi:hypothetical protein
MRTEEEKYLTDIPIPDLKLGSNSAGIRFQTGVEFILCPHAPIVAFQRLDGEMFFMDPIYYDRGEKVEFTKFVKKERSGGFTVDGCIGNVYGSSEEYWLTVYHSSFPKAPFALDTRHFNECPPLGASQMQTNVFSEAHLAEIRVGALTSFRAGHEYRLCPTIRTGVAQSAMGAFQREGGDRFFMNVIFVSRGDQFKFSKFVKTETRGGGFVIDGCVGKMFGSSEEYWLTLYHSSLPGEPFLIDTAAECS